jgi:hypothetical protein
MRVSKRSISREPLRDLQVDPCKIVEIVDLSQTNKTALKAVRVGQRLQVEFRPTPPQRLVVMTKQGSAAGAIVSPRSQKLIDCIEQGRKYVAKVIALSEGQCRVLVQLTRAQTH